MIGTEQASADLWTGPSFSGRAEQRKLPKFQFADVRLSMCDALLGLI